MDQIIQLAERLGKAIAESPAAVRLTKASKAMNDQPELSQLLKDFQAQTEKVAALEAENKPIEVDDKRKLKELNDKLLASEIFKEFTAAQVDYVDLMRKVNQTLQKQLAKSDKA